MTPILFMRTAWMKKYRGLAGDDPKSAAKQIVKYKFGHEVLNFRPYAGHMYGFARPHSGSVRIERLGASKSDTSISDVLVVWTAPRPRVGVVVVGWYKHARVYRKSQRLPASAHWRVKGHPIAYYVSAKAKDCTLLNMDDRVFRVPGQGQSLIRYADSFRKAAFLDRLRKYIASDGQLKHNIKAPKQGSTWQQDAKLRLAIETAAVELTGKYFEDLNYRVTNVGLHKMGWDLEARFADEILRIEVKGRAGATLLAELTPREYQQLEQKKETYRVSIVTRALSKKARMHLFAYSPDNDTWESEEGRRLKFVQKVGAIISC